ncbi:MAG: hypothetical protein HKP55_12150 [Gammaproteobacteria bacterium]|nr:hypothetical protein [Gammaproteobacteria bacterium]
MFSFQQIKRGTKTRNIVPLVVFIIIAFLCLVFFIYFIYGQYLARQELVIQDIELESQKMRINSELAELARSRTRLTSKIIDLNDIFEQDELNQELETYANRFALLISQLFALELTKEEKSLLDKQLEIIPVILPNQRRAVELAMSDDPEDDKIAQNLLYEIVLPGQTEMIRSLAKLIELEQDKIALLSKESKVTLRELNEKSTIFIILTLLGIIIISFFVISRIKRIQVNLQELNNDLENRVAERTLELTVTNNTLENIINELGLAQQQLIESEKMAALGGLVSGVAHEINTPVGISVTASSIISDETKDFKDKLAENSIKRSTLTDFIERVEEASLIIQNNLYRASELIRNFKQVAVDQSYEEIRKLNLPEYLNEILTSLSPKWKNKQIEVVTLFPDEVEITTLPGVIAQIITNLVVNSLLHGFDGKSPKGKINIEVISADDSIIIDYSDDGKGMSKETLTKIYDPFFTTKRGSSGTGLGMHLVYNLVSQKLKGNIECISDIDQGCRTIIRLPKSIEE